MTELSCLLRAQVAIANVASNLVELIPHIGDNFEERSASGPRSTEDEELIEALVATRGTLPTRTGGSQNSPFHRGGLGQRLLAECAIIGCQCICSKDNQELDRNLLSSISTASQKKEVDP